MHTNTNTGPNTNSDSFTDPDFLEEVAEHILATYGTQLNRLQVVFPNRRAGQFLLHHLAKKSSQPIWAPQVLSMEQFLEQFTELRRADSLLLCFKMFPIYQKLMPGEQSFDQFYSWAEILLQDFNSLDQQCVEAEKVFFQLKDLKQLEAEDAFSKAQKEALSRFWSGFQQGSEADSTFKKKFMAFWQVLPALYKNFKEQLVKEGIAYSGLIARAVAENPNLVAQLADDKVLFCGFNALTRAEERVMKQLLQKGKAGICWDVDAHLLKPEQEAGKFMRRWQKDKDFGPTFPEEIPNRLASKMQDKVRLTALPLEHVQAREVGRQLQEQLQQEQQRTGAMPDNKQLTRTAIVLPDESQLFPLLYQLPTELENSTINVTMGVPLRITPVYSLMEALLDLQRSCQKGKPGAPTFFHHKPVVSLLRHAYIRGLDPIHVQEILSGIEGKNQNYVSSEMLRKSPQLAPIFSWAQGGIARGRYLLEILELVNSQLRQEEMRELTLEEEYISRTRTHLERMLETAEEVGAQMTTELLEKLLRHLLQQLKIPFVGEPLQGLQLMGMLETRCLDFDHIYVLSLNEGVVPAASDESSLIPFFIRTAYGLPTTDEHDAIYAYHFYRLLQRAKNVHLFYSTYRAGGSQGELSRYVKQLQHELWPSLKPQHLHLKAKPVTPAPISISRAEAREALLNFTDNGKKARQLSPSALNTWLHCRLQFAFRYLLKIKEPDEVQEEVDNSIFGLLMHEVLEALYKEFGEGSEVSKEVLEQKVKMKPVFARVLDTFEDRFGKVPFLGRNSLPLHMVAKMVEQVLEVDKAHAPFRLVGLEKKYEMVIEVPFGGKSYTMRLQGNIDRVDEKDGKIRVLDYKTGKDIRAFKNIEELFDRENTSRNKAAMQVLLYTLLYTRNQAETLGNKELHPALYNSKELYAKGFNGRLQFDGEELNVLTDSMQEETEQQLKSLLQEILAGEQPFDQREDEKGCEYCGYAGICGR